MKNYFTECIFYEELIRKLKMGFRKLTFNGENKHDYI